MNYDIKNLQRAIDNHNNAECGYCSEMKRRIRLQQIFNRENAPKFPAVDWTTRYSESGNAVNPDRVNAPFQSPCAGIDLASGPDESVGCFVTAAGKRVLYESAVKHKLNEALQDAADARKPDDFSLAQLVWEKQSVIERLLDEGGKAASRIAELETRVRAEVFSLKAQVEKLNKCIAGQRKEINAHKGEITRLHSEKYSLGARLNEANTQNERLILASLSARADRQQALSNAANYHRQLAETRDEARRLRAQFDKLIQEIERCCAPTLVARLLWAIGGNQYKYKVT